MQVAALLRSKVRILPFLAMFSLITPLTLAQHGAGGGRAAVGGTRSASGSAGFSGGTYGSSGVRGSRLNHSPLDWSISGKSLPGESLRGRALLGRSRLDGSTFGRSRFVPSRFDRYGFPYSSLAFPFFDDLDDSDDPYSTGYPVASALPPFLSLIGRRRSGELTAQDEVRSSSQPLMIEFQNGQYVRVNHSAIGGEAETIAGMPDAGTSRSGEASRPDRAIAMNASGDLPPTTLIFRDGHKEEVRDYAIANGTLYARGDFYTDGYRNKDIKLSSLDIGQTLQANAEQGVKFVLPSSANEVITRP